MNKINELISKYDHIFSKDKNDLGFYDKDEFKIDTGNEKPVKSRAYRVPFSQQENIENMVDEMLQNKIISKSIKYIIMKTLIIILHLILKIRYAPSSWEENLVK